MGVIDRTIEMMKMRKCDHSPQVYGKTPFLYADNKYKCRHCGTMYPANDN